MVDDQKRFTGLLSVSSDYAAAVGNAVLSYNVMENSLNQTLLSVLGLPLNMKSEFIAVSNPQARAKMLQEAVDNVVGDSDLIDDCNIIRETIDAIVPERNHIIHGVPTVMTVDGITHANFRKKKPFKQHNVSRVYEFADKCFLTHVSLLFLLRGICEGKRTDDLPLREDILPRLRDKESEGNSYP